MAKKKKKKRPKKWIQKAIKRPGAFTRKAKKAGKGVQAYARQVAANPERYSSRTVRQANLAITLSKMRGRGRGS